MSTHNRSSEELEMRDMVERHKADPVIVLDDRTVEIKARPLFL